MKVSGKKTKKMDLVLCLGFLLTKNIKVNGKMIFLKEKEHTSGTKQNKILKTLKLFTRDNGLKERGKVMGLSFTIMDAEWKEPSPTTSKKDFA